MQACEIISRSLFVSRGYSAKVFDCIEEALHEIAFCIKRKIAWALHLAIRFWRNDGFDPAYFQTLNEGIAVVSLVGKQRVRRDLLRQVLSLGDIVYLTAGKTDCQRIAKGVDNGVYLCR